MKNVMFEGLSKVKSYCNSVVTVAEHVAHTKDKKKCIHFFLGEK